jgi:hypothetical protein
LLDRLARRTHATALKLGRAGMGGASLRPGTLRCVGPTELIEGVVFDDLYGEPRDNYEFLLKLPDSKRILCAWVNCEHGELELELTRSDNGKVEQHARLHANLAISMAVELAGPDSTPADRHPMLLRIGSTAAHFSRTRLYLRAC